MATIKNNSKRTVGVVDSVFNPAKGAQELATPYTTKVCGTRPELKLEVETFVREAKLLQQMERQHAPTNQYQQQVFAVMKAWNAIYHTAYWNTSSGKKAYEVIGNELYKQVKHGFVWDDYEAEEVGASSTFVSESEQLAASTMKVYAQARAMGIRNEKLFSADELSLMMQDRQMYKIVDKMERDYDLALQANPRLGTIIEQGRRRRKAEDFVETVGHMMDKVRDGKATPDYTKAVLDYVVRSMESVRKLVLNWNRQDMLSVKRARLSHAKMHLVYVANNLLDMLQEVGLYKGMAFLQEYKAALAGEKHRSSSWTKKDDEEQDVLVGAVEYKDISGDVDALTAEEELIRAEADELF